MLEVFKDSSILILLHCFSSSSSLLYRFFFVVRCHSRLRADRPTDSYMRLLSWHVEIVERAMIDVVPHPPLSTVLKLRQCLY